MPRKKLWRIPPKMWRYLVGVEGYSGGDAHVRWLAGELNRLRFADQLTEEGGVVIRDQIYATWLDRLKTRALDSGFLQILQQAGQMLANPGALHDIKACLAEAYLVLTQWKGRKSFATDRFDIPLLAYLERFNGEITTRTVREYAELLWKVYYGKRLNAQGAQQEWNFGPVLENVRWSRLFDELGLTPEFLPRSHGGRPRITRKRRRNKGKNKEFSGSHLAADQV
jgi:hypothetical protein